MADEAKGSAVAVGGQFWREESPEVMQADYAALTTGAAVFSRTDRGLLRVTGRDRQTWLHNLSTNHVKALRPGEGNYAFFLSVQGRIVFDANILVEGESVLLDIDLRYSETARKHLGRYAISEDVAIGDEPATGRFAVIGPRGRELLESVGLGQAANLPLVSPIRCELFGRKALMFRTDFCGEFAVEIATEGELGDDLRQRLVSRSDVPARWVTEAAVQVRRIEAGIPWSGAEITDDALPAETRQLARAVSFNKGCYLGQEVVERMRSRGVVARQLVGLKVEGSALPTPGTSIVGEDQKVVGVVTSGCLSMGMGSIIALAYIKTANAQAGVRVSIETGVGRANCVVASLPFLGGVEH